MVAAGKEKTPREADVVKMELQCIPSLQDAKNDLIAVADALVDGEMKSLVQQFISQIEKMQEQVLSLTMRSIKDAREVRKETEQEAEQEAVRVPGVAPAAVHAVASDLQVA